MKKITLTTVLLVGLILSLAAQSVSLSYIDRAPYYYQENGVNKGFLLDRAEKILKEAGLTYTISALPPNRITAILETQQERHISIGWFKRPEREVFAQFSVPIYRNKPQALLVLKTRAAEFKAIPKFAEVAANPKYKMGAVDGFSYGGFFDPLIATMGARVEKGNVTPSQNVAKLQAKRFDFLVLDQEEASYQILQAGLKEADFEVVTFSDVPEGNLRYLWCSKNITAAEMTKINAAIVKLYPEVK